MAGNITIVEAMDRYVKVPRDLTRDGVSLAAVGLYAAILSFGKEWNLNIRGLASILDVSPNLITTYLGQLERAGYVRRSRTKGADGRFTGWDYQVGVDPFTDIPKTPTSEKTDTRKNRLSEKPIVGKTDTRKSGVYNKDNKEIEESNITQDYNGYKNSDAFDFRHGLVALGVPADMADDFLKCRHTKRLADTKTALDGIAREIQRSGRTAEDCIRLCVERGWGGFRAEWLLNDEARGYKRTSAPRREESLTEHYARVNRELEQILHPNGPDYDNQ